MERIRTVLIDIDGVLTVSWQALPGAPQALGRLRAAGLGVAFVTNTTSRDRASIAGALAAAGFTVDPGEVFTAPAMAAAYLAQHHPAARCHVLNSGDIRADLDGVALSVPGERPDVIVLGGAGPEFSYEAVNQVFAWAMDGVPLVALHRNLFWRTGGGLQLDTGAYLHGLEQALGRSAVVVGKPAAEFFATALRALGARPAEAVMIGDDIEHDVLAAARHGLTGVLVRTGKFRSDTLAAAAGRPDHVIDSFADLPALLDGLG
jgi:HAD superfamily hydrolase (TIGR01458 family)